MVTREEITKYYPYKETVDFNKPKVDPTLEE